MADLARLSRAPLLLVALLMLAPTPATAQLIPTSLSPTTGEDGEGADLPVRILPHGRLFSFRHEADTVFVFVGGVEVRQGSRRIVADTAIGILGDKPDEDMPKPGDPPSQGTGLSFGGSRLRELWFEGDVVVEDSGQLVLEAEALYADNQAGTRTLLNGRAHTVLGESPMVIRFHLLSAYATGEAELTEISYSVCDKDDNDLHITSAHATLTPVAGRRILDTTGNTIWFGSVPLFWFPGIRTDLDKDGGYPLRRVHVGSDRDFGTELITEWGGDADAMAEGIASLFGHDGPVDGDWWAEVGYYSRRGLWVEPHFEYETDDTKGEVFFSHIRDSGNSDELDVPITDHTRGRFDVRHRTYLERTDWDDFRVLDVEVSYLSDRNFLREYYEHEFKTGKEQETYVWFRDIDGRTATTVLVRGRLNDFQSQVEYLPEVERLVLSEPLEGLGGAFLSIRDIFSHARLRPDDDLYLVDGVPTVLLDGADVKAARGPLDAPPLAIVGAFPGERNTRLGRRMQLDWPIDISDDGSDRLHLQTGIDLTFFERTQGHGFEGRHFAWVGAEYGQTWVGVDPDAKSELWNFDGVRQILEPRIGTRKIFGTNLDPVELHVLDDEETFTDFHVVYAGIRHRVQTHQAGQVKTIFDLDVLAPFYPNQDRDNLGRGTGNLIVDMRWKPGANIWGLREGQMRWRSILNHNDSTYERSFLSYTSRIDESKRFYLARSKVRHVFDVATGGILWDLTPKWTAALFLQDDRRDNELHRGGFLLRNAGDCWTIDYVFEYDRGTSTMSGDNEDGWSTHVRISPTSFLNRDKDILDDIGSRFR